MRLVSSGGFEENDTRIAVRLWNEVLNAARRAHIGLLSSLLLKSGLGTSELDKKNLWMSQIHSFGGEETIELLKKFEEAFGLEV